LSVSAVDAGAFDLVWWGSVDFRRRDMTDEKAQQLVDRNRLFLELQQLTINDRVETLAIKSVFGPEARRAFSSQAPNR
jgi:hypothetical protein